MSRRAADPATHGIAVRALGLVIFWIVAVSYGYGALVHVQNMLGMSGFDWAAAPGKWRVLDVVYLVLDVIVFVGFLVRFKPAIVAFYVAASSQIVLYTVLRPWITDVPEPFTVFAAPEEYLDWLVVFHVVALILVTIAVRLLETVGAVES